MKSRRFALPVMFCLLYLGGCATTTHPLPNTFAAKHVYDEGHFEDPKVTCELGYQKVYYVANSKAGTRGGGVLVFADCVRSERLATMNVILTIPDPHAIDSTTTNSDRTDDHSDDLVRSVRTPLIDLSAH